jgi:AraC family transcriptional regulator of adaptative response / DNA-3-methyladenine glycosylase II
MLPFRAPYDWDAMAGFLAERAIAGVEAVGDAHYARSFRVEGATGVLRISPSDRDALRMTVWTDRLHAMPAIISRARRVFDLAADPQVIGAHLAADVMLAPLVAARPGLRAPGAWDGFELAMRAILGQQVTVGAARSLAGKLTARFGETLDHGAAREHGITHIFPSPERLIGEDIASLGMPQTRGRSLEAVARAAQADPRLFGHKSSLEAAIAELCALPGIGEWTAQYIALRALREPDAFPQADVGLMRAMADVDGRRPTPGELQVRAEPWRPWRAYAAQHLWAADAARLSERRSSDDQQVA